MKIILLFFTLLAFTFQALACIHYPIRSGSSEVLKEGTKHVFMYHDGKKAHMIINTDLSLTGDGPAPDTIAWVLPFPSKPTKYKEVDAALFSELKDFLQKTRTQDIGSYGVGIAVKGVAPRGIKTHKVKYVGNYRIQPIEILTEESGKELSDWLLKNGYNSMPEEKQKPYLKKGAFFLAVKMKVGKPKDGRLNLKPLHITYSSPTLSFPLRFTHDTRTFGIELFVFTPYNIYSKDREVQTFVPEKYLTEFASSRYNKAAIDKKIYPSLIRVLGKLDGYLYRFTGENLNSPGKLLKDLDRDPVFNPEL